MTRSDDNEPTSVTTAMSALTDRKLRWRFRQNYDEWREFLTDLRDPDSGFAQEFPLLPQADRERLADAIEAALLAVAEDDVDGTA